MEERSRTSEKKDRISRLVRNLVRPVTEEEFMSTIESIKQQLTQHENRVYVQKSFGPLSLTLADVFKGGNIPSQWRDRGYKGLVSILVCFAESMDHVSNRLFDWMVDQIKKNLKSHSTVATLKNILFELIEALSPTHVSQLGRTLYSSIEETDNTAVFKLLSSLIVACLARSDEYPYFQDFVDLVIGWMVDETVVEDNTEFCSQLIFIMRDHFIHDNTYARTLLNQILEDMEAALNNFLTNLLSAAFKRIVLLGKAYVCIVSTECYSDKIYLSESTDKFVSITSKSLTEVPQTEEFRHMRESLLFLTNESIILSPGPSGPVTTNFIKTEISWFKVPYEWQRWPLNLLTDVWNGICAWVENTVSVTQITDDEALDMCHSVMSVVDEMMYHTSGERIAITLVQALFRSRNVTLLQKVYEWHRSKVAYGSDKKVLMFIVAGLSDIAVNRSGAILSLYALDPTITEFLLSLATQENLEHFGVKLCVVKLLRSHCIVHSHFLSSLAKAEAFGGDSPAPGIKVLPPLMDYWIHELRSSGEDDDKLHQLGLWEWLEDFLKMAASSSYAHLLHQIKTEFFPSLIKILFFKARNGKSQVSQKLLLLFTMNSNFLNIEGIKSHIETECVEVLESSPIRENKLFVFEVLKNVRDIDGLTTNAETEISHNDEHIETEHLTPTEFNTFLYYLLSSEEPTCIKKFRGLVPAAVSYLIRCKLKTQLGKPQDLFGHIQAILKRKVCHKWKLEFVYELEKAFQWLINGSSLKDYPISQQLQSFYLTNKGPCMEWLKRIRTDLFERGIDCKEYAMAYYNASKGENIPKTSVALFELHDTEGIKGLENRAAWLYLEGNFEEAMNVLKQESLEENPLKSCIEERATLILSSHLRRPDLLEPLEEVLGRDSLSKCLLLIDAKTNVKLLNDDQMNLWDLLTLCHRSPSEDSFREKLEQATSQRMLSQGNLEFVREWLALKGIDWRMIRSKQPFQNPEFVATHRHLLQMSADLCLAKKESEIAASIFNNLLEEIDSQDTRAELILKLVTTLRAFPEESSLREIASNLFENGDKANLEVLYEKALHLYPSLNSGWLAFGDFNYDHPDWDSQESQSKKKLAVECYSHFLRLEGINGGDDLASKKGVTILVISRLLKLFKEGFYFDPTEVIISPHWIDFIPEISQIPDLRIYLVRRFPREASFAMISLDSTSFDILPPTKRKNLFDSSAYTVVEISDEPWSMPSSGMGSMENYECRSELHISDKLKVFARELLRIGTSSEEMWGWNLQRILVDWNKRVNSLKRDMARDPDPAKIKAYVEPVRVYLEDLWEWSTTKCGSPAELEFVQRTKIALPKMIESIGNCTSVDALTASFDRLLLFADTFASHLTYKCSLRHMSPRLADMTDSNDSLNQMNGILTIPGMPPEVTVELVEGTVYSLATKTRPKKIRLRGSDGKKYEYLVKGNENLSIDAAVMQCLTLIDKVLGIQLCRYAITPLGKRGGLIRMVEKAVPLFQVYKKYLQKKNCAERTSEMFWRRMDSVGAVDRSKVDLLKQVFALLGSETPKDLISRELYLSANDHMEWFSSTKTFTRSCGESSAVGFVLGIGDRHLDNMLVDLSTGRLIHVDFSLMFNKGSSLAVPECVPFRLTQNLIDGLQFPGPEGAFSVYLEQSLQKLTMEEEFLLFCANTIAFACQLDEDAYVNPELIRRVEVKSAYAILKFRFSNIWKSAQAVMEEIKSLNIQLDMQVQSVRDWEILINTCESNIEKLTVALGTVKECQNDPMQLADLRSRCINHGSVCSMEDIRDTESTLVYLMENFVRKSVLTENNVQWSMSMDKVISSQLQAEVQTKFSLSEELGRLRKQETEILTRLQRRINRWRRMLANLDPLMNFIVSSEKSCNTECSLVSLVTGYWNPLSHFWLQSPLQQLMNNRSQFEAAFCMANETMLLLEPLINEQDQVDRHTPPQLNNLKDDLIFPSKIKYLVDATKKKLCGFNTNYTVKNLIEEATSVDNLCKMYEGWTPWV